MDKNITAMVFTFNEERRLPFVYQNLKDFCEIIVFDGGSTDGTEEFCRKNNIKFVLRPSHTTTHTQENRQTEGMWPEILRFAYSKCPTEYVLHVFGAHFFPPGLLKEFSRIAFENQKTAVYCDLVSWRYGSIVHQAFLRRVSSVCVFYKKSIVDFEKTKIHDELAICFDKDTMTRLRAINDNSLFLFQDETYLSASTKNLKYAEIDARQRFGRGQRYGLIRGVAFAVWKLFYSYIRLGSFRFGSKGFAHALINFQYELSIVLMVWELSYGLGGDAAIEKNDQSRKTLLQEFR